MTKHIKTFFTVMVLGLSATISAAVETDSAIWINEFHYDNTGGDTGEFIEIVAPATLTAMDLMDITVTFYTGSDGSVYDSFSLDDVGVTSSTTGDYTIYRNSVSGIQNGAPDGIALSQGMSVLQFLSYEGDFTASGGAADGLMSTDIGVAETSSTPVGHSLQLTGVGDSYGDFFWSAPLGNTDGMQNVDQILGHVVIGAQDFDAIGPSVTSGNETMDMLSDGGALTDDAASYDGSISGGGLAFSSTWHDSPNATGGTGPVTASSDTSDFIGVNEFTGGGAPNENPFGSPIGGGDQFNFEFNDTDGRVELAFEPVDLSGYEDEVLSLWYWIDNTGYETDDTFRVTLSDGVMDFIALELTGDDLEDMEQWNLLQVALDATTLDLDGSVQLLVDADTNSAEENIFIDNVRFSGVAVAAIPEPQSIALWMLLGLATLSGCGWWRKRG